MRLEFAIPLAASGFIAAIIALYSARRRHVPGARGLATLMVALMVWSLTYSVRWLVTDPSWARFWLDATYFGVVLAPTALLTFTLQFTDRERSLTRNTLALLAIVPLLTLIVLWTDDMHGLMFAGSRTLGAILNGGPWFWLNATYSYLIQFLALGILLQAVFRSRGFQRSQALLVALGMIVPFCTNILSVARIIDLGDLDLTPFTFVVSGSIFALGIFRYGLLDIVPIARDRLIEQMRDGVVVVDTLCRIIDINPSGLRMTGLESPAPAVDLTVLFPELEQICRLDTDVSTVEMAFAAAPDLIVEVSGAPISRRGVHAGFLLTMRDITPRKMHEAKLEEYRAQLEEMSKTDELTGIANRRHGLSYLREQFEQFEASGIPFSLIIFDLDRFKLVNDTYGHVAGDWVLRHVASRAQTSINGRGLLSRMGGGEEFLVTLPCSTADEALDIAESIRRAVGTNPIEALGSLIPVTLSAGVTVVRQTDSTFDDALIRADRAMYAAKDGGRDRVSMN